MMSLKLQSIEISECKSLCKHHSLTIEKQALELKSLELTKSELNEKNNLLLSEKDSWEKELTEERKSKSILENVLIEKDDQIAHFQRQIENLDNQNKTFIKTKIQEVLSQVEKLPQLIFAYDSCI